MLVALIGQAAEKWAQVVCLQELFYGPYFCAEQQSKWYGLTEPVPGGPTLARMQKLAKKYSMVLVVPVYEVEMAGVYFNRPRYLTLTESISGSTANTTFPIAIRDSGRSSI